MGLNGSGKSTLANVLAGRDSYDITEGAVTFNDKDLLELEPEERAGEGLFLAFQYPVEIPGVNNTYFLRAALNALRKYRGDEELDAADFLKLVRPETQDTAHRTRPAPASGQRRFFRRREKAQRDIPDGGSRSQTGYTRRNRFRAGHRRNQDGLSYEGVNALRSPDRAVVVITHYQRLLNYIIPDFVHVLMDGAIVKSGGKELALELEEKGYAWLEKEFAGVGQEKA